MALDSMLTETYTSFVEDTEPRLRQALVSRFGPDEGRDATAEAGLLAIDGLFTDENRGWAYASFDDAGTASQFGAEAAPQGVIVLEDRIIVVGTLHGWADPAVWIAQRPSE